MMPILPTQAENLFPRPLTSPVGNERGAALIMAIVMLVILSVLGSVVLMSSDTELKISRNYQGSKQTFWVADRAVEYATSREILMALDGGEINLNSGVHKTRIEDLRDDGVRDGVLTSGVVRDLGIGSLPASAAGAYGSDFGANYYQVSVTARQSADPNAAAVNIDASIVRIFKNDDESIYMTDGEG